ncbi:MAG: hypothetical protein ACI32C_03220 [Candidatus Enteromonas sp.]
MKDKLVKTNRKRGFYRIALLGKVCAFAAILGLGSALPIVIVASASTEAAAKEALQSSSQVDLDEAGDSSSEEILSYVHA